MATSRGAGPGGPGWSVGDLARACGLTPRVLRHWEALGVVSAERDPTGHRRYRPQQVTRLFRDLALRRAGLGLAQVAALLDEQDPDPVATLRAHLSTVDVELRRRTAVRDRLAVVLDALDDGSATGRPEPEQTLRRVIETMTMFEQYVHGHHETEEARLVDQAGTLVDLIHHGVAYAPGERVLEVGCGTGAQTMTLLERSPGIELTSVAGLAGLAGLAGRSR